MTFKFKQMIRLEKSVTSVALKRVLLVPVPDEFVFLIFQFLVWHHDFGLNNTKVEVWSFGPGHF